MANESPQIVRMQEVELDYQVIENFLHWIEGRGLVLARYDEDWDALLPDYTSEDRLLAEFFGIDYDQLLVERARFYDEAKEAA